jgi:hypothetical protein
MRMSTTQTPPPSISLQTVSPVGTVMTGLSKGEPG